MPRACCEVTSAITYDIHNISNIRLNLRMSTYGTYISNLRLFTCNLRKLVSCFVVFVFEILC